MGFSHSWVAVRGVALPDALAAAGLELGAAPQRRRRVAEVVCSELADGWLLFLSDNFDDAFKGDLTPLTRLGSAVACAVEEHVMCSEARGYEAGVEVWRVVRDPDKARLGVTASGDLPAGFEEIRDGHLKEQMDEGGEAAGVDVMFDVPPRVAQSVCGFFLGEDPPGGLVVRDVRKAGGAATAEPRPGFFARLFRRG